MKTPVSVPLFDQAASRARLRRSRTVATGLLVAAAVLFVFATLNLEVHPAFGYLKAFAEASMVGGLADWFAVVALFRHPLGLPVPHTAILPKNQNRIADELARFIENNFLLPKPIGQKIYQLHPASKLLSWLSLPENRAVVTALTLRQTPNVLKAVKPAQMAEFLTQLLKNQYDGAALGRLLSRLLAMTHVRGYTNVMLTVLLQQIRRWLAHDKTRQMLETQINRWAGQSHNANPGSWDRLLSALKISAVDLVDGWVARKVLDWADSYCQTVLEDKSHPMRAGFERKIRQVVFLLHYSGRCHRRLDSLKTQLAQSDTLTQMLVRLWETLQDWSSQDSVNEHSLLRSHISRLIEEAVNQAAADPALLRRLDTRMALWGREAVSHYKHQAARFVADKVKSWDSRELVDKLESSVGRDLQFIRVNGTLVGGLVGLAIYTVSRML